MELEGIAIVGLAARVPSGLLSSTDFDYTSFWDFLMTSGKAYEPLENLLPNFVRASTQVKLPAQGSFLKDVASFDNISRHKHERCPNDPVLRETFVGFVLPDRAGFRYRLAAP
ncbi:hypothetical protein FB451DRAFT_1396408 [Mycena latifolia]|nr:hypothetical protein FB451DRAFT_1396408 [Mycena latifolia]